MKTKLILAAAAIILISAVQTIAQSWNINGNTGINPATNFIGTTDYKALRIKTNNTARIFIHANGNVGIGINTPTVKLDVNGVVKGNELLVGTASGATGYIASIGGKLIAEEVRVDLEAVWPDYVFADNYKLMSLSELEESITCNKHLPGIPAAAEMKDKGIMLGEMQTMTMEKVEEAMLYIIQLNKENNNLKAQIADMQNQISDLSTRLVTEKK